LNLADIRGGAKIVKEWEKQGYGFRFKPYKYKSPAGYWGMGYRLIRGKKIKKLEGKQ
jgi:hypothetical protein